MNPYQQINEAVARQNAYAEARQSAEQDRSDWIANRAEALMVHGNDFDPTDAENIGEALGNGQKFTALILKITKSARTGSDAELGNAVRELSRAYCNDRAADRAEDEYDEAHNWEFWDSTYWVEK